MPDHKAKLELTWVGKENRPKLEPRVLIEDGALSYHAARRIGDNDLFDNRLIFGDNLLALKALEQEFTGKIKCIYIDPPFNTGDMFENYDDGVEHSLWLRQMRDRFEIIYRLMHINGSLFVHLNDDELDYCKVILDEVFGRRNFVNRITIDARSPSAFSTVNPGVFKASEYILWYAKNKEMFTEHPVRTKRTPDYAYNKWLSNPNSSFKEWTFIPLLEAYEAYTPSRSRRPDSIYAHFNRFIIDNAAQICRLASISDSGAGQAILDGKQKSLRDPEKIIKIERGEDLGPTYILGGQQIIFYDKNVFKIEGQKEATAPLTNIWTDIAWEGIAQEGGVTFRKGKKPERLIQRCLELASKNGDIILDSFAGSGTTGAVAHKMGRRWIMVELGEHCRTHIIPRLKKVIDGEDAGGITNAVGWKGGGGFRYYRLAPSLIVNDAWDNPIINPEFNASLLAEAMCKLEGFVFDPNPDIYWQQGRSSETDFIYVTTQALTRDMLAKFSDDVGPNCSLLVCCGSFRADVSQFENLTVKKIPKAVLKKCEWGHDDYSLEIKNLPAPQVPPPDDEWRPVQDAAEPENRKKARPVARKFGKGKYTGPSLFDREDV